LRSFSSIFVVWWPSIFIWKSGMIVTIIKTLVQNSVFYGTCFI
jgi:hypothetical protein